MIRVGCLRACKKEILGREASYSLFYVRGKDGGYFAVKVSMDGECKICKFGKDRAKALEIFKKIVKNRVTPCSLNDIAEDFKKEA